MSKITNAAAGAVPMDALLEDVDINALVDRIDLDEQLARIDLNAALVRVDMDQLMDQIDLDEVMSRIDINKLMDRVDVDSLLDRVDVNALLDRVDANALLDRVDVDSLLDRVDTDALIARTDLNAALDQVDLNQVMDRIDVQKVVERAGIPEIVQESTGHMAESMLDLARRQIVAMDQVIMRITLKVGGRSAGELPAGPPNLVGKDTIGEVSRGQVTGHYAGPLSRLLAYMIDVFVILGAFTMFSVGINFVFGAMIDDLDVEFTREGLVGFLVFWSWAYVYYAVSLAVAGRTLGMGIIGMRVVQKSGSPLKARHAFVRTLAMPISFLLFGLGFIGLLFGRRRRALHDWIAGTVVVYDWGDRPAEMAAPLTEWLGRHDEVDVGKDTAAASDGRM